MIGSMNGRWLIWVRRGYIDGMGVVKGQMWEGGYGIYFEWKGRLDLEMWRWRGAQHSLPTIV